MQSSSTHQVPIIRLAAWALLALCLSQQQVHAQKAIPFVFHTISWGMARGQTARFTVVNPDKSARAKLQQVTFVQVMLLDARGALITQSDEIAIPPGEFRSVDFNRDDLPLPGELSGRLQVQGQVKYRTLRPRPHEMLLPSLELIDNNTGQTQAISGTGRWWVRLSRSTDPGVDPGSE